VICKHHIPSFPLDSLAPVTLEKLTRGAGYNGEFEINSHGLARNGGLLENIGMPIPRITLGPWASKGEFDELRDVSDSRFSYSFESLVNGRGFASQ